MILLMGKVGSRQHRVLDSKNSPYYKGYFALPFYVKRFLYIYFNIAMIQVIMFQFKKILKLGITVAVVFISFGSMSTVQASILESDLNKNGIPDSTETSVIVAESSFLDTGEYQFNNLIIPSWITLILKGDPEIKH